MSGDDEKAPDEGQRGAVFMFVGFLILLAGMWGWAYYELIVRG